MSENDIGLTVAIATGVPDTFDAAGFEALTWVEIVHPITVGEIGDDHESIAVPNLTTGRTRTIKGAAVGATIPFTFGQNKADVGQIAVKAACATAGGEYSFRVTNLAGDDEYISGVPMSFKRSERSSSSYAGIAFSVSMNYAPVEVAAA